MADAVNRCFFQWDVGNPFLPCRTMEARFFHGSPTVTRWKVSIEPLYQRLNYWKFSFYLKLDEWLEDVVAEGVRVVMHLDGRLIAEKEEPVFHFCLREGFTYYLQRSADVRPQAEPHHLVVRVEISLRATEAGNELFSAGDDLRWLSSDLKGLLKYGHNSNMTLLPRGGDRPISAHSYVMYARWNNFFDKLSFHVFDRNTVETDISRGLLLDILNYMYSGELVRTWPDWIDLSYTRELFRVIYKYRLNHFRKVFWKSDWKQVRATAIPVHVESRLFRLSGVEGIPVGEASHTWPVNPKPEYDFVFQIRVGRGSGAGPWLEYSLRSRSPSSVCGQVNVEVVEKQKGKAFRRILPLHELDFAIDRNETVKSGSILFLGCPETFGDPDSTAPDGEEIEYYIRCFLRVTDGTAVDQVQCEDRYVLEKDLERFNILSEHMYSMRELKRDSDMKIQSRSFDPISGKEDQYQDRIHKGICATRVLYLGGGLENPDESNIPVISRTFLSWEMLPYILDYMYTGRGFSIPKSELHEVKVFAQRTRFYSLIDLVRRTSERYSRILRA